MQIKVLFFTRLREIVNKKEETLAFEKDQVTVKAILDILSKKYGDPFIEYSFDRNTKQPKGFLQFLINGTSAATRDGLETPLKDGDVLAILPPVGGG